MSIRSLLKNESGSLAIIGALVILILISVISISASRVANTEIFLARNEVVYQRNFYLAEGAALEAADHLTQYGNLRENTQAWMEMVTGDLDTDNVKYYWDNTVVSGDTVIPEPSEVDPSHTLFIIGHEGTAKGFSLDMDKPTVHAIAIYGRCEWDGVSIIKMGYQAAY
jgi:type II secretory pathway pseudopilin PulG